MDQASTIRRAGTRDKHALADVLSAAFENDPFMTWLLPATETRLRKAPTVLHAARAVPG
jgi:hypothetical protein